MTKFPYKLGCLKSRVEKTDYIIGPYLFKIDTGEDVDYRDYNIKPNQQGHLGSCVGASGERYKVYLDYKDTGKYYDLSEMWLYEKARIRGGHEEGAQLKDAWWILAHEGIPEDRFWPYTDDKKNIGKPAECANENALQFRISDKKYFRITSAKDIRETLISFGPIHIAVGVYENWDRQKDGHIPTHTFCDRLLGYHAIFLEGHLKSKGEFVFLNSWGDSWGDKGRGYLTETEMNRSFVEGWVWMDLKNTLTPIGTISTIADLPADQKKKLLR